jgi:hypothetical protein
MTKVIIHFFRGKLSEAPGKFNEMKSFAIDHGGMEYFKDYLLEFFGHVGISFPPDREVYGFGPNITQEDLNDLGPNRIVDEKEIPWTAENFLFDDESPKFKGTISVDTQFFAAHVHVPKIPLILVGKEKEEALDILRNIDKDYGLPRQEGENCLTAIFKYLPLTYSDGTSVLETLSCPSSLIITLQDLKAGLAEAKKGGKKTKRKKTKRKRRKRRKKKTRRNKRKKKKLKKKI